MRLSRLYSTNNENHKSGGLCDLNAEWFGVNNDLWAIIYMVLCQWTLPK